MPSIIPKITINGKESTEISGLMIVSLPPITKPAMRAVAEEIDGRDGDQIEKLGFSAYDKTIRIALSGDYDVDDVIEYFNQDGIITFSNEPDKYYHFKQLEGIDFEKLMRYKTADVVFHCQPFKFSTTEEEKIFSNPESVNITNSGNYFSKPEIVLTGKGNMEMSINDAPVLAIDFGDEEQTIAIDAQSMNAYGTKNNIKRATFEINPSQDLHGYESAWLDSETPFKKPYNLINVAGTASRIGNSMIDKIVGGSFAFNQLCEHGNFDSLDGWDHSRGNLSIVNNILTYTITEIGSDTNANRIFRNIYKEANHKILVSFDMLSVVDAFGGIRFVSSQVSKNDIPVSANTWTKVSTIFNASEGNETLWLGFGQMSAQVGDEVKVKNAIVVDLTQMLGSTIADYIYSLEQATAVAGVAYFRALFPDDYSPFNAGELLSVKTSAHIMRNASNAILANYPLDANLELRGIPQIDANGNLSYDGDEYTADGNVLRKYGIVDLGSLDWGYTPQGFFNASLSGLKFATDANTIPHLLCLPYVADTPSHVYAGTANKTTSTGTGASNLWIRDDAYTDATSFKTAMNGIMLIYEKESPTTETAQPFASPQIVDASGSMEYVDARAVKIPVGHVSMYANNCEILGFTESNVSKAGKNLLPKIPEGTTIVNGITFTVNDDGTVRASGNPTARANLFLNNVIPVLPAGTYKITAGVEKSLSYMLEFVVKQNGTSRYFATRLGNVDEFTLSEGDYIESIYISVFADAGNIDLVFEPQLELGSEATEFSSYVGKIIPVAWAVNQWDEEWELGGINANTGNNVVENGCIRSTNYIPVSPNKTYFFRAPEWEKKSIRGRCYDADKNYIGSTNFYINTNFTIPNNCYYFRFSTPAGAEITEYNNDISINSPASDHNYHAYSGIPTAYRAQLIFLDGTWELRLLSKKINMGSLSWEKFDVAQGSLFRSNEIDVKKIQLATEIPNVLCGLYPTVSNAQRANHSLSMANNTAKVDVIDDGFSDVASFETAMKNIDLEYEMQSPVSVSLSADELTSLLGINNIWHDANGETQITFTKDGDVEHETSGMIATFYIDVDDLVFGVFKNRLIIGDYDKIQLKKGSNTISFAPIEAGSEISEMAIDFYSRWL